MTPRRSNGRGIKRQVLFSLAADLVLDIDAALAVPTSYGGSRSAMVEVALYEHLRGRMEREPLFRQAFTEERSKLASEHGRSVGRLLHVVELKKGEK